jgi:Protein of unknown function (DUF3102)
MPNKRTQRRGPVSPGPALPGPVSPGTSPFDPVLPDGALPIDVPPPQDSDEEAIESPEVQQLTGDILQHHATAGRAAVAARAEIGRLLLEVRSRIPHGAWLPYLQRKLPFSLSTAHRAIQLHHFRNNHPALFKQLEPLGVSKAMRLAKRPVAEVAAFLAQPHVVPATGAKKTPLQLSYVELLAALDPPKRSRHPGDAILDGYRRSGRRFIRDIATLIEHRQLLDRDDVTDLYDDLLYAVSELATAFDLETD